MTAPSADALVALDHVLGWWGGWLQTRSWAAQNGREGRWRTNWHQCGRPGSGSELAAFVAACHERYGEQVMLSLPRTRRWGGSSKASALWARVEGKGQRARLDRFRPEPTILIQEGSSTRQVAFWQLDRLLTWHWADKANRRLAHHLGAVKKWADPDEFWFPAPGCCLREGRGRPVPVVAVRLEPVVFRAGEVVGRERRVWPRPLRDPPVVSWQNGVRLVDGRRVPT